MYSVSYGFFFWFLWVVSSFLFLFRLWNNDFDQSNQVSDGYKHHPPPHPWTRVASATFHVTGIAHVLKVLKCWHCARRLQQLSNLNVAWERANRAQGPSCHPSARARGAKLKRDSLFCFLFSPPHGELKGGHLCQQACRHDSQYHFSLCLRGKRLPKSVRGNIPLQNHTDGTCWDRGEFWPIYVLLIIVFQEWARG